VAGNNFFFVESRDDDGNFHARSGSIFAAARLSETDISWRRIVRATRAAGKSSFRANHRSGRILALRPTP
jgi:hypothetical protein